MLLDGKENLMRTGTTDLSDLYDTLSGLERLRLSDFDPSRTALVVVDMINGFVKEGPLASPNAL